MAGNDGMPPLELFSPDPWHTVSTRWDRWLKRFENYVLARGIKEDIRKRAMLLHCVGEDVHMRFETLGTEEELKTYDLAVKALNNLFNPQCNKEFEVFQFNELNQLENETIDQYYCRLEQAAMHCGFENTDKEVKSQIIQKTTDAKLRNKGLFEPNTGLQELLQYGRTNEATIRQKKAMEDTLARKTVEVNSKGNASVNSSSTPVHRVVHKPRTKKQPGGYTSNSAVGSSRPKVCFSCPAKGKSCRSCGAQGHFAKMCEGTQYKPKNKPARNRVHQLVDTEEDDFGFGVLYSLNDLHNVTSPYCCKLKINGVEAEFEIDTGVSLTIMNETKYKRLCYDKQKTKVVLNRMKKPELKTYSGNTITAVGTASVCVEYGDQQKQLELVVVPGSGPSLLGRNWLHELKLDWKTVFHTSTPSVGSDSKSDHPELSPEFSDVFSSKLGCYTGGKVTVHLKSDATPHFLKARSVPFSLKPKVLDELDQLEQEGVIRQVDYSEWATPIVPVLKPSGQVRICGDYKITLNMEAQSDFYPLPRIEELYTKLGGGVLYSKLDLSHAYQQLELDSVSQEYTTINTPKGLFAFTRLPFGVSCAPGIFQRTMESLLSKIPMCAVYFDDILISGKTVAEHDTNVRMVLKTLLDSGLRLKQAKCLFSQSSVEYLGHRIDSSGIHPKAEKVQGINDAPVPKDLTQLRSYLGILNYYHKFLPNLSS